ncbi:hypothetical protein IWQ60_008024 [Tieghemiomyces parasiticus]|uniref:Uncharacterized protein n=1 Tax=Tieghemiomyces parasiticus TaxID=78921 RepID=A0A9W8A0Q2_9FUNG|nr:hypothetical protein IWQ60_008024 [Tieghemiomyces parasiticus]
MLQDAGELGVGLSQFLLLTQKLTQPSNTTLAHLVSVLRALLSLLEDVQVSRYLCCVPPAHWYAALPSSTATQPAHVWVVRLLNQVLLPPATPSANTGASSRSIANVTLALLCCPTLAVVYEDIPPTEAGVLLDLLCRRAVDTSLCPTALDQYHHLVVLLLSRAGISFRGTSAAQRAFLEFCIEQLMDTPVGAAPGKDGTPRSTGSSSTHATDPDAPYRYYRLWVRLLDSPCDGFDRAVRRLEAHRRTALYRCLLTRVNPAHSTVTILALRCLDILLRDDPLDAKVFNPANARETLRLAFHMITATPSGARREDLVAAVAVVSTLLRRPGLRSVIADHPPVLKAVYKAVAYQWRESEHQNEVYLLLAELLEREVFSTELVDLIYEYNLVPTALASVRRFLGTCHPESSTFSPVDFLTQEEPVWWAPAQLPHAFRLLNAVARLNSEKVSSSPHLPALQREIGEAVQVLQSFGRLPDTKHPDAPPAADCPTAGLAQSAYLATALWGLNFVDRCTHVATFPGLVSLDPSLLERPDIEHLWLELASNLAVSPPHALLDDFLVTRFPGSITHAIGRVQAFSISQRQRRLEQTAQLEAVQQSKYRAEIERLNVDLERKLTIEESQRQQNQQLELENCRVKAELEALRSTAEMSDTALTKHRERIMQLTQDNRELTAAKGSLDRQCRELTVALEDQKLQAKDAGRKYEDEQQERQILEEEQELQQERWSRTVRELRHVTDQLSETEASLKARCTENQEQGAEIESSDGSPNLDDGQTDSCKLKPRILLRITISPTPRLKSELDQLARLEAQLEDVQAQLDEQRNLAQAKTREATRLSQAVYTAQTESQSNEKRCSELRTQLDEVKDTLQRESQLVIHYQELTRHQQGQLVQHERIADMVVEMYAKRPRLTSVTTGQTPIDTGCPTAHVIRSFESATPHPHLATTASRSNHHGLGTDSPIFDTPFIRGGDGGRFSHGYHPGHFSDTLVPLATDNGREDEFGQPTQQL